MLSGWMLICSTAWMSSKPGSISMICVYFYLHYDLAL